MLNVNKWLADALASGGIELKCSEEPMRENVGNSTYITWEHGTAVHQFASGVPYEMHHPVRLYIWMMPCVEAWQALLSSVESALNGYHADPSVSCCIRSHVGAVDAPTIGRKAMQIDLTIVERLWYT